MQLDGSMQDAARACATDTAADLKPWRQAGVELFPPWFDNSRVRHAGLPRKAAVPPLGPVWPLPPIAGSEFRPSSGLAHYNKTISHAWLAHWRQHSKSRQQSAANPATAAAPLTTGICPSIGARSAETWSSRVAAAYYRALHAEATDHTDLVTAWRCLVCERRTTITVSE